jgi:hypothetical protein
LISSCGAQRHPSDDGHEDLHDGTQEMKAERSVDASSHQFGAKNERANSTLLILLDGTLSQIRGNWGQEPRCHSQSFTSK